MTSEGDHEQVLEQPVGSIEWALDPGVIYLNHGSFGACPRPVLHQQARLRELMEREPVTFLERELQDRLDAARAEVARLVGADPGNLAFVPNATHGVNTVLRSLELAPGDEIVVTDHEYPACRYAADFVAGRSGARVVPARLPFPLTSADEVIDAVESAVSERTRFVLLDHVTSPTGLVLPVERLIDELQVRRGIDVMIDGAHALGMLGLQLDALSPSYYTANAHKWLCTPKGSAILYVRPDRQAGVRALSISHGAGAPLPPGRARFQAELDWTGTFDPTAVLSMPSAIACLEGLVDGGLDGLRRRNRRLVLEGRRILCEGLGVAKPAPEQMIGSLASVPIPLPENVEVERPEEDALRERLLERHGIEVFVQRWPSPRARVVRISAQAYNRLSDYRALLDALRAERNASWG
jgi:isopenicillin-N epimerase